MDALCAPITRIDAALARMEIEGDVVSLSPEMPLTWSDFAPAPEIADRAVLEDFLNWFSARDAPLVLTNGQRRSVLHRLRNRAIAHRLSCPPLFLPWSPTDGYFARVADDWHLEVSQLLGLPANHPPVTPAVIAALTGRFEDLTAAAFGRPELPGLIYLALFARSMRTGGRISMRELDGFEDSIETWAKEIG